MNLPPPLSRFLHHDAVAGIALVLTTILGVILGWIYTPEVLSNLSEDMKSSAASSSTQESEETSSSSIPSTPPVTPVPVPEPEDPFDPMIVYLADRQFPNGSERLISFNPNNANATHAYMVLNETTIRYYKLSGFCEKTRTVLTETQHTIWFAGENIVPEPDCGMGDAAIDAVSEDFSLTQPIGDRDVAFDFGFDHF